MKNYSRFLLSILTLFCFTEILSMDDQPTAKRQKTEHSTESTDYKGPDYFTIFPDEVILKIIEDTANPKASNWYEAFKDTLNLLSTSKHLNRFKSEFDKAGSNLQQIRYVIGKLWQEIQEIALNKYIENDKKTSGDKKYWYESFPEGTKIWVAVKLGFAEWLEFTLPLLLKNVPRAIKFTNGGFDNDVPLGWTALSLANYQIQRAKSQSERNKYSNIANILKKNGIKENF